MPPPRCRHQTAHTYYNRVNMQLDTNLNLDIKLCLNNSLQASLDMEGTVLILSPKQAPRRQAVRIAEDMEDQEEQVVLEAMAGQLAAASEEAAALAAAAASADQEALDGQMAQEDQEVQEEAIQDDQEVQDNQEEDLEVLEGQVVAHRPQPRRTAWGPQLQLQAGHHETPVSKLC